MPRLILTRRNSRQLRLPPPLTETPNPTATESPATERTVTRRATPAATVIETPIVKSGTAAALVEAHPMQRGPRGARREVTEVGEEAGAVKILADTHVVTEEMEISTAVVATVAPVLARQMAVTTIVLGIAETVVMTATATIGAVATVTAETETRIAARRPDLVMPRPLR